MYPKLKACLRKNYNRTIHQEIFKTKERHVARTGKKTAVVDVTVTPLIYARHVLKSSLAPWKQQSVSEG